MNPTQFFEQLEASIARYDLLCHPFYKAWSAGELTRDDLREYARQYYHHVKAFPGYLAEFGLRLDEGELRRAVLANMCDEKGTAGGSGKDSMPHSEPHSAAIHIAPVREGQIRDTASYTSQKQARWLSGPLPALDLVPTSSPAS